MKKKNVVVVGIGKMAKVCILKGYTFGKTYETIKKSHKNTNFSKHCYYWYRIHLRTDDKKKVSMATIA